MKIDPDLNPIEDKPTQKDRIDEMVLQIYHQIGGKRGPCLECHDSCVVTIVWTPHGAKSTVRTEEAKTERIQGTVVANTKSESSQIDALFKTERKSNTEWLGVVNNQGERTLSGRNENGKGSQREPVSD